MEYNFEKTYGKRKLPWFIEVAIYAIVVLAAVLVLYTAAENGVDKQEQVACHRLDQQSQDHKGFWITESQKIMCDYHGIFIDAPLYQEVNPVK